MHFSALSGEKFSSNLIDKKRNVLSHLLDRRFPSSMAALCFCNAFDFHDQFNNGCSINVVYDLTVVLKLQL